MTKHLSFLVELQKNNVGKTNKTLYRFGYISKETRGQTMLVSTCSVPEYNTNNNINNNPL